MLCSPISSCGPSMKAHMRPQHPGSLEHGLLGTQEPNIRAHNCEGGTCALCPLHARPVTPSHPPSLVTRLNLGSTCLVQAKLIVRIVQHKCTLFHRADTFC